MFNIFNTYESKKERNFYSKVFAGCIFNELLSNYKDNIIAFLDCIKESYKRTIKNFDLNESKSFQITLDSLYNDNENSKINISFDYHNDKDPAEAADILIIGQESFIAIEAKLYDDWKFKKDICQNKRSIEKLKKTFKTNSDDLTPLQVLLISKDKWDNAVKKQHNRYSQFTKLKNYMQETKANNEKFDFTIIFWEDISNFLNKNYLTVSKYINWMLEKNNL